MLLKKSILVSLTLLLSSLIYSMPPIEILQTCKNNQAINDSITIKEIDGFGYNDTPERGCRDQVNTRLDGKLYGSMICDDKLFFIIADKKISSESAFNYSTSSNIKPTQPIPQVTGWWLINASQNQQYICIEAPLSDTGSAANLYRYYLIEDPFNTELTKNNIYFYFFDNTYGVKKTGHGSM